MTETEDEAAAVGLRRRLAEELSALGELRSPGWRRAVEDVPRHLFVPEFFRHTMLPTVGSAWEPVSPERVGRQKWLELAYENTTWVTQLDGHRRPDTVTEPVSGEPTSSSSLPGLVVRMLEDLGVDEGDRVLEIGTGTGYSTALMAHRLGPGRVTSIEYDAGVGQRAAAVLHRIGYAPTLVVGDGLLGHPDGAPYDRLIATCAVRSIPPAWVGQVRPGGTILATVGGWLHGYGLARLTVADDWAAQGHFLPSPVSFMLARPHTPAPMPMIPLWVTSTTESPGRPARVGPEVLKDWVGCFVVQCAVPNVQYKPMSMDGGPMVDYFVDTRTESVAALVPVEGGGHTLHQSGPERLWDAVEEAVAVWRDAGSPDMSAFGLTATPHEQRVWLGSPDGPSWRLPN